ncbi:anti-sigma factor family protein [Paracoccus ravus]|uniref:anti-sigma factor family protein n=1 Tax=Paracoccus ravus TaxID=2447760 RepID=UPI00106EBB38|nr:anti-sigma factor [Paracoccus ravus]
MHPASDGVSEFDLNAYVDDQLDEWQRLNVEEFLARHPNEAARVMQDIRIRRELRLALATGSAPSGRQRALAARFDRAVRRDQRLRRMVRIVPVIVLLATGWLAHEGFGPLSVGRVVAAQQPAPVVAAALAAREASLIRLPMRSQPQTPDLDPAELRAATGILLPAFDRDWQMRDAQIFPSPQGPGVEIVFDAGDLGRVTHFAVRTGGFDVTLPHLEEHRGQNVAWFQLGETAHVLIAESGPPAELLKTAESLSSTLY